MRRTEPPRQLRSGAPSSRANFHSGTAAMASYCTWCGVTLALLVLSTGCETEARADLQLHNCMGAVQPCCRLYSCPLGSPLPGCLPLFIQPCFTTNSPSHNWLAPPTTGYAPGVGLPTPLNLNRHSRSGARYQLKLGGPMVPCLLSAFARGQHAHVP